MALQVTVKDGNLIVAIPLQTPNPSKSGKTLVVATTHGNAKTAFELPSHPGKQLTIGVNAYIPK